MTSRLIVLLIIICLFFIIYIFSNIFKRKISLQFSLLWFTYIILLMILLISIPFIGEISKFLGFEVSSNMIFFFGFVLLIIIAFSLSMFVSILQDKIKTLTQEVAILKKELNNNNEDN